MEIEIKDFLPKYPSITPSDYEVLNPYNQESFERVIFRKKEFYENKLTGNETFPRERGMLTKHQQTIARYMSSHTPYDRVLLVHAMGTGKTCSAIGAIEQIRSENSTIQGAIILANGRGLLNNFINEIVFRCTDGKYIPENFDRLTEREKTRRIQKKIGEFYSFHTFTRFAKQLKKMDNYTIQRLFSNHVIIIDEVHNLRIQPEKKQESLEKYEQYYRLLHSIKNSKVIMLSGTPMKDGPEEIASVMNLLIPEDDKLPVGEEFLNKYMIRRGESYKIRRKKIDKLRELFRGKVSFLREGTTTAIRRFIGEEKYGDLEHFIVYPVKMSKFQREWYQKAYDTDSQGKGVFINSREATLFVYPDGSWGKKGFSKYIIESDDKKSIMTGQAKKARFKMNAELRSALQDSNHQKMLKNLQNFSASYSTVIERILQTNGNCFIYSWLARGSGGIVFSKILELFGYTKATGNESTAKRRYAILTNETSTPAEIRRIVDRFNQPDNYQGDFIQVIIGSRTVSEGFSFNNVIFEAILTPHWNYSETAQAIARGLRFGSHRELVNRGINPIVEIMQIVSVPKNSTDAIDLIMYKLSEDKDVSIRSIMRLLMEISFDCGLNYMRNYVAGYDSQRECDYVQCDYECNGVNINAIRQGLNNNELDYSTYQLFYSNPALSKIRSRVLALLRKNFRIDLETIIGDLTPEFSEEQIINALHTINEEAENGAFDYKRFSELYLTSPLQQIVTGVSAMFRNEFSFTYGQIASKFPDFTSFEIISALREIISKNTPIRNKYGFDSYLREDGNVYFLVGQISDAHEISSEFYSKYPTVHNNETFDQASAELYSNEIPRLVKRLFEEKMTDDEFTAIIKSLPIRVQEMLIETGIDAKEQNIKKNRKIREKILEYFVGYITRIRDKGQDIWVSTRSELRCKRAGGEWTDCDRNLQKKIAKNREKGEDKAREDNPYELYGKYNPENNAFCIVDLRKEKVIREKMLQKGRIEGDKRLSYSGMVCGAGGWNLTELVNIMVFRLRVDAPDNFLKDYSQSRLQTMAEKNKWIQGAFKSEISSLKTKGLRRLLYWGLPANQGGAKNIQKICVAMRQWLESRDLLFTDNQCGVQGKRKKPTEEKKEKTFRIERIKPGDSLNKIKNLQREINKIGRECGKEFDRIDLYSTDLDWYLIFYRKILAGFVVLQQGIVLTVCISENYQRQNLDRQAAMQTLNMIARDDEQEIPVLYLPTRSANFERLLAKYRRYGFFIEQHNDQATEMIYAPVNEE